jgi:hypothetical protein
MTKRRYTPGLRLGGRHYWEIYQAWQIEKKANLVRLIKVSFFDLSVSRKSPAPWHFLAISQRLLCRGRVASNSHI